MASGFAAAAERRVLTDLAPCTNAAVGGVLICLAAIALALQLTTFPNHDVAWILWGTREMLDGAEFGRDIIEPNPPLAWYLAVPSTWLAGQFGIPVAAAFRTAVTVAALASLTAFQRLLPPMSNGVWHYLPLGVASLFLLILPGREFGQREHLMIIAVLPYLALVGARCGGRSVPVGGSLAIGLAAGLGFALKPYFLVAFALVELTAMLMARRWAYSIRPEVLAILATIGAYVVVVLMAHPAYLTNSVPLASLIYWSFDRAWSEVLPPLMLPLAGLVIGLLIALPQRQPSPLIVGAATIGFAISYVFQHKGYSYHLYPALAAAAIMLALLIASPGLTGRNRLACAVLLMLALTKPAIDFAEWCYFNSPNGQRTVKLRTLVRSIDRHAGSGSFLAAAVHPYPAFPTALYVRADYVSRTNSQWFLPAVVQARAGTSPNVVDTGHAAEKLARGFFLRDLSQRPDVVVINTDSQQHTDAPDDFDFLAFYNEDSRIRALWLNYREAERVGKLRVFVRSRAARS